MRRIGITLLALAAAIGGFLACVGDEPSASSGGPAMGEEGGPCFPNQTCLGTLTCSIKSNVCVDVSGDGGADGTTNTDSATADASGTSDVSVPDTGDAATAMDCGVAVPGNDVGYVRCFANNDCLAGGGLETCCRNPDDAGLRCASSASCGGTKIECSSPCAGGQTCCATLSILNGTEMSCPAFGTMTASACSNATTCTAPLVQLCSPTVGCPAGKTCRPLELSIAQGNYFVGACL